MKWPTSGDSGGGDDERLLVVPGEQHSLHLRRSCSRTEQLTFLGDNGAEEAILRRL